MRKKPEGGEIMKIRLVLYSLDRSYREHLVNYLGIHHGDTLEINMVDETHALEEFLKEYRADIILLDQELSCRAERGETLIRLSEERGMDAEEPVIYKYQRRDSFPAPCMQGALKDADRIWLVADGTAALSEKYGRFPKYVAALERRTQSRIFPRMRIFYNKYSSRTGRPVDGCELPVAGGSPRYEHAETDALIRKMAGSDAFEKGRVQES